MGKAIKWVGWLVFGLVVLFFVLPNIFVSQETEYYSEKARLQKARELYPEWELGDSIEIKANEYLNRSQFHTWLYGEKNRELWNTTVKAKVLRVKHLMGGMHIEEVGGGEQTINLEMESAMGHEYNLRSISKDQSHALPKILRYSYARQVFRDQAAAMNPFAPLVLPVLSEAIGIMYLQPQLVFVPYDSSMEAKNTDIIAGQLAYLEQNSNSSWLGFPKFRYPKDIMHTEAMFELARGDGIPIDTFQYLKCRLFDMLISDWDRHEGQWEWALTEKDSSKILQPIPKDRDMTFYKFDEGVLSHITLWIEPKFQSFNQSYNVEALVRNSRELDKTILEGYDSKEKYEKAAAEIQTKLTPIVIKKALKQYPPEIYKLTGKRDEEILAARLKKLPKAANDFYLLMQEEN